MTDAQKSKLHELIEAARALLPYVSAYDGDTLVSETQQGTRLRKAIEDCETGDKA